MSRRKTRVKTSTVNVAAADSELFSVAAMSGVANFEFIVVAKKPIASASALRAAIQHLCEYGVHDDDGSWSLYVAGFQPNVIPLETSNVGVHAQHTWQQR